MEEFERVFLFEVVELIRSDSCESMLRHVESLHFRRDEAESRDNVVHFFGASGVRSNESGKNRSSFERVARWNGNVDGENGIFASGSTKEVEEILTEVRDGGSSTTTVDGCETIETRDDRSMLTPLVVPTPSCDRLSVAKRFVVEVDVDRNLVERRERGRSIELKSNPRSD